MPILDTQCISVIEKLPGWRGRIFHSPSLTFGHWDFSAGSPIQEHVHPQEEVWELLEGALELTIDGTINVVRTGIVPIVPPNGSPSARAFRNGPATSRLLIDNSR